MSWTLGQVKARVRSLLDDPEGGYLTDSFLTPLICEVYDDANSQLAATQSSWDITVVELAGILPGTPNLAVLQSGSGPLATLTDQPLRLDWKPAGSQPSQYRLVRNYEVLPDLQPRAGLAGWEFRSQVIWLTPSSIAVDVRVRGEFAPPVLQGDDSVLVSHPRIGYVVAYGAAALVATVRGNDAWTRHYEQKALEGMDEILEQLVRAEQGQVRRAGRQCRRS